MPEDLGERFHVHPAFKCAGSERVPHGMKAFMRNIQPFQEQFKKITLPFVIFSTTPVLISQFIGNFNNFGVFFFLRSNVTSEGYFLASDTDLLINWLYRMSIDKNYYSIGAAISLVIFIITSVLSLIVYVRSASYKKEDTFR